MSALAVAELPIVGQQQLESRALSLPDQARFIVVRDQATLDRAAAMLTEQIKPLRAEVAATFNPVIEAAHKSHKEALAAKARVETPLIEAESILKNSVSRFAQEQERIRQAEERRMREEAARQQAEALRLQREEAERIHAAEVEAELEALPLDIAPEVVREICERPAPEVEPMFAPAPVAQRTYTPVAGLSVRETWSAEVFDMRALARAIADGKQPVSLIDPNMAALNGMARSLKRALSIPGVRAVSKSGVAASGRR